MPSVLWESRPKKSETIELLLLNCTPKRIKATAVAATDIFSHLARALFRYTPIATAESRNTTKAIASGRL